MLDKQQSELLKAIFTGEDLSAASLNTDIKSQGLSIYQESLIANAARALSITFATLHSYIGHSQFNSLVREYVKAEFKQDYDWGEFGSTFASFIATQAIAHSALFSDIAKLDFACHLSERSRDIPLDLATLNRLNDHDAYDLYIQFCSGAQLIQLSFPLDELINQINSLTQDKQIEKLDDVTQQITDFLKINTNTSNEDGTLYQFIVWRPDFQAQYTRVSCEESLWINALLGDKETPKASIGQALDNLQGANFSFVEWLPKAIQDRLINCISTSP